MSFNMKKALLIIYLLSSIALGSESNSTKGKEMPIKNSWEKLSIYLIKQNVKMYHEGEIKIYSEETTCKGASPLQLKQLQSYYKVVPSDLIKSLSICNESNRWFGFNSWGTLYGIEEIISTADDWKKYNFFSETGVFDYVYGDVSNPKNSALEQWIPIYDWNGNYVVAIDMLSKNKGQVIVFCMEDGTLAKWANSYEEWFELVVEEVLKYGELRVETIESVLALAINKNRRNHVKE